MPEIDVPDTVLPHLKPGQIFACSEGCGECGTQRINQTHYERFDAAGNRIEHRQHKDYVSDCCSAQLDIWDTNTEKFIEWPDTSSETEKV